MQTREVFQPLSGLERAGLPRPPRGAPKETSPPATLGAGQWGGPGSRLSRAPSNQLKAGRWWSGHTGSQASWKGGWEPRALRACRASVGCTWPGSCKGGSRRAKAQGRPWLQPRGHLFRQAEHHVTDTASFRREQSVFEEKGLIACNTERKAAPTQSLSVLIKGQPRREFRKNNRKPEFSIGVRVSVAPRRTVFQDFGELCEHGLTRFYEHIAWTLPGAVVLGWTWDEVGHHQERSSG